MCDFIHPKAAMSNWKYNLKGRIYWNSETLKGLKKRWLQRYFLQKFFFFLSVILSFIKMEYLADQRK